ncbi:MAG: xylulokinase [Proteobacteria bacterium]|nr:xylulokinase [Pseudomonadota bacterium]
MYVGIDLGTSGVKSILVDDAGSVVDQESAALTVSRPRPLWSEQDPEDWWQAADRTLRGLGQRRARELSGVRAVGLSGQMHGATLLDDADRVLRPAILWNDGRSAAQCEVLERRAPRSREITGNLAMPGFTAPKLLWVAEHEPEIFQRIARVLLPKDTLRLRLTGEAATDLSDASGTLWLDVGRRAWSDEMLAATDLTAAAMPALFEGSEPTGTLKPDVADAWGLPRGVLVAAGAGDQAAGAAGAGVVDPGRAFLSLGTSGVFFVAGDAFAPDPEHAVHAFCHCLPGRWHQMSVVLSAASCLTWIAGVTGAADVASLLNEVELADRDPGDLIFLPYLSGERTPHNDPFAKGVFFGLTHESERADLARAVLEGVALAMADGERVLRGGGARIDRVSVIGGGARSPYWGRLLASALDLTLDYSPGAEVGPAYGAARLARIAATGEEPTAVCTAPAPEHSVEPDPALRDRLRERGEVFRGLYADLRERFRAPRGSG